MLNMESKHYSKKVMKFVYFRSAMSLPLLNMGPKRDLCQLKNFVHRSSEHIYAEYGVETLFEQSDEIRVMVSICSISVLNFGSKHDLRELKDFVYWLSSYSLTTLFMGTKHDSRQVNKFVYSMSTYSPPVLTLKSLN